MNQGATFVKNYFLREWTRIDRNQDVFTILPDEKDMSKVLVLFTFTKEITETFNGLQLVFQIILSEEHPYKPPSIKTLTPNARTKYSELLCIDGLTAYHPESWKPISTFRSIIDRFIATFIDTTIESGVGFYKSFDEVLNTLCISESKEWNYINYPELVELYKNQCEEFQTQQMFEKICIEKQVENNYDDCEQYIYSDEE